MTFDAADLLGGAAVADAVVRIREAVRPRREGPGWATVELDRAEASFGVVPSPSAPAAPAATRDGREDPDIRDDLLGAFARLIRATDDREIALLEPFTEGRLAAVLARHGEGFVALYLIADSEAPAHARAAGLVLSAAASGPFGTQYLVVGGPHSGPFIILAAAD